MEILISLVIAVAAFASLLYFKKKTKHKPAEKPVVPPIIPPSFGGGATDEPVVTPEPKARPTRKKEPPIK